MFITIINDCSDENAKGRQEARVASLFSQKPTFIGLGRYSEIAAAGNLVDVLDATGGREGIVMVNVAPRHGRGKRWPNGTPFAYFRYQDTLVISTVDGYTLSLLKKFDLLQEVSLMDIMTVMTAVREPLNLDTQEIRSIAQSQFRSYDFVPFVARWLRDDIHVPHENYPLTEIPEPPHLVWWVDNFGNVKTTLTKDDVTWNVGSEVLTTVGAFTCYEQLKDVPDGRSGLVVGSSGIGNNRFLEIVVQGRDASKEFGLFVGDTVVEK